MCGTKPPADGPVVTPTHCCLSRRNLLVRFRLARLEERREIRRAQMAPSPRVPSHRSQIRLTHPEGSAIARVGIVELPNYFLLRRHLKDQPGFARADQRVAVGQPIRAGNRAVIHVRLAWSGKTPNRRFRLVGAGLRV